MIELLCNMTYYLQDEKKLVSTHIHTHTRINKKFSFIYYIYNNWVYIVY